MNSIDDNVMKYSEDEMSGFFSNDLFGHEFEKRLENPTKTMDNIKKILQYQADMSKKEPISEFGVNIE